jgi:hypothetical protein
VPEGSQRNARYGRVPRLRFRPNVTPTLSRIGPTFEFICGNVTSVTCNWVWSTSRFSPGQSHCSTVLPDTLKAAPIDGAHLVIVTAVR